MTIRPLTSYDRHARRFRESRSPFAFGTTAPRPAFRSGWDRNARNRCKQQAALRLDDTPKDPAHLIAAGIQLIRALGS